MQERIKLARKLKAQHPDRVPVVVQTSGNVRVNRDRFLAPDNIPLGRFLKEVREHTFIASPSYHPDSLATEVLTPLTPEQGMYLMAGVQQVMPPVSNSMRDVYNAHKDAEDDILYLTLCVENTFGAQ